MRTLGVAVIRRMVDLVRRRASLIAWGFSLRLAGLLL